MSGAASQGFAPLQMQGRFFRQDCFQRPLFWLLRLQQKQQAATLLRWRCCCSPVEHSRAELLLHPLSWGCWWVVRPDGVSARPSPWCRLCPVHSSWMLPPPAAEPGPLIPITWPRALFNVGCTVLAMLCFQKLHVNRSHAILCTAPHDKAGWVASVPNTALVPPCPLLSSLHLSFFFFFYFFFFLELYCLDYWDNSGDFAQRLQEYN